MDDLDALLAQHNYRSPETIEEALVIADRLLAEENAVCGDSADGSGCTTVDIGE